MPEYCERMMKKEESFLQSHSSAMSQPPEDMGFFAAGYKKLENREQRRKEVQQALEEIPPTFEEKGVDDLECELQLSPMDVDSLGDRNRVD